MATPGLGINLVDAGDLANGVTLNDKFRTTTALVGDLRESDTTLVVADASGLPAGQFTIRVDDEVMRGNRCGGDDADGAAGDWGQAGDRSRERGRSRSRPHGFGH